MPSSRAFLAELGRRRIGRVVVAYAIAAWALIQVADVILPRLAFPDWTVTLLIVVAIAGLPVAIALAWFYDVVPDPAEAGERRRARSRWVAAGVVGLVVILVAGVTARVWPELMDGGARIESIAVLPFDNLSSDAEQEYFVAGMHDALITELAQIASVRVVSRMSTLRFADSDASIGEVARELGVDGVIEGSVLKVGGDLRLQVQLIRAGPRERHVWAESYERRVEDARRLHGEIARTIASEIRLRLSPDEEARLTQERAVDPRAYEAYLRGMYFLSRQTPEDSERGLRYLQQAVQMDPADADAYAGLALGYSMVGHGLVPDAFERAKAAAERSLRLDSTVVQAHEALAEIALYHDWDFDVAERSFRRVLSLAPNFADAAAHFGWLSLVHGRGEDALAWERRAATLDPLNPLWAAWVGWIHSATQSPDSALAWAERALELEATHPHALLVAAGAAATLGDTAAALEYAARLDAMPPFRWGAAMAHAMVGDAAGARAIADAMGTQPGPMDAFGLAIVHAQLGETDAAVQWLRTARDLRFSWMPWIHRMPELTPLHGDPGFEALARELGLVTVPLDLVAAAP